MIDIPYRGFYLVTELGWIDDIFKEFPGWQAASVGKYCPLPKQHSETFQI